MIVPPAVNVSVVVFVRVIAGPDAAVRVTAAVLVTLAPVGGLPVTDAAFVSEPASTSACVATYLNVQFVEAPGVKVTAGQVPTTVAPARPSEIWTPVNVTFPVFLAVIR